MSKKKLFFCKNSFLLFYCSDMTNQIKLPNQDFQDAFNLPGKTIDMKNKLTKQASSQHFCFECCG